MATSNPTVADRAAALSESVAASPITQKQIQNQTQITAASPSLARSTGPRASTSTRQPVVGRKSTTAVPVSRKSNAGAGSRTSARDTVGAVPIAVPVTPSSRSASKEASSSSGIPEGEEVTAVVEVKGEGTDGGDEIVSNPRLEGMRYALRRFLELLDMQMTSDTMQTSLPMISSAVRESARKQMVEQLREATQAELETVIRETALEERLAELQEMTRQAAERERLGLSVGDEEMRDVWRPDIDIPTALHARSVPEQQARVTELEQRLAQIRSTNAQLSQTLRSTSAQADAHFAERAAALDTLDETVAGLQLSDELEARLRDAIDGMRDELGARR